MRPVQAERRDTGPPLPPGPGGVLPLALSTALAGFVPAGMITLASLVEAARPGGTADPVNLLLLGLVLFPLAIYFGLAVDRDGFGTLGDGLTMRPTRGVTTVLALLFGLAAVLPLAEIDNVMQAVFPMAEAERRLMVEFFSFDGWGTQVAKVLAVVAVTPVGEELVYRGIVLRWLRRSYGRFAGISVSAVLFAAAHLSLRVFVPILLLGLFLGWVTDRSRSVMSAIVAHSIFNAAPFLVPPVVGDIPGWTPSTGPGVEHLPPIPVVASSVVCLFLLYALWWATLRRDDR